MGGNGLMQTHRHDTEFSRYISWPVIALMDFVTVIGFDDIIYNFQNQGLAAVGTWVLMLFLFVVPYEMMVGHLGSVFSHDTGGLTSWVRETGGEKLGYWAAWTYWVSGLPYIVDVANSTVVSFGWMLTGNGHLTDTMKNSTFALLTALIFVSFILIQHRLKNSLQWLSVIGGGAMFIMTVLYVIMTFAYLGKGRPIETQPFTWQNFIPKFDGRFWSTLGLFIFAMNGSEFVAPYVNKMKNGQRDFPKAMWMLAIMTGFLTILGTFSLGVFFNAYALPHDLKMNGSYYAFQAMGQEFGLGSFFLYTFAITQAIYMMAQLAVLLDAGTRMFLSDTAKRYLPKALTKLDRHGLPINGYWLTIGICTGILVLSAWLPSVNDMFNALLNLNGIISPYTTCFLFFAFFKVRQHHDKFPSDYTYLKNDTWAMIVGAWCFVITFGAATFGIIPVDAQFGTETWNKTLIFNIVGTAAMVLLGYLLPLLARYQQRFQDSH